MAVEIERKFLVRSETWRKAVSRSVAMKQGYLTGEGGKSSVRVRLEGDEARFNIKAAVVGHSRAEFDWAVPVGDAREILDTLCVGVVEKVRHYVQIDGLTWEIDAFAGANAGLIVAELELERADQAFAKPDWLGDEVTDDRRYYNHHLALHPYSTWPRR